MPIDPSIAMGVKAPQFESPVNALGQLLQVQAAQQQNQLGQAKFDEYQRGADRTNRLNSLLANIKPDAPADEQVGALTRGGFLPEARSLAESSAKVAKEKRDAEKAQWEAMGQKLALGARILGSVKDQASYDAARVSAQQAGLDVSNMPPQYDPAFVAAKRTEGLTTLEQFEQGWKQKGFDLELKKADEQTRHNDATEKLTAAGQSQQERASIRQANTQIQVQKMIGDRQDARGEADANSGLDAETKQRIAKQVVDAGDYSGMKNIGRGAQGARDIREIQNEITRYATSKGIDPTALSAKAADFEGLKVGLRTSANISARVENAISEAKKLAPLAVAAGREVSRSGFLPFGKANVMFDEQTNNPALKKFAMANNGLVTAYAGAMARGQKPTQAAFDHAQKLLGEAQSQAAYEAGVDQLYAEMDAASAAPQEVREHLRGQISGGGNHTASAPQPPATNSKGWTLHVDAKGNRAYVSPDGKQYEEVH